MERADTLSGRRIALIVDHPLRDLAGSVLVAQELCQRGAVCHLVPMNLQEAETWALRPDFVLLNFLRQGSNDDFARHLVRAGIHFGLLDTEGGVWPSAESYAEILWNDRALLREARCACMWGPRLAGHLLSTGLLEARQVFVTGCARFDTYHSRWKAMLEAEGPDDRPRILINTNYYTANGRFVTADENRRQLEEMGWTAAHARETVDTEAAALESMIALADVLSHRFPAATVVVRPHPFENPKRYRDALGRFANIEINQTGPVQPQLHRAIAVIQRSCTTAIEATLASVPAISPRWIPAANENPMAEDVSIPCDSAEALFSVVRQILEGRHVPPAGLAERRANVIHDWFFKIDGMAHLRVTEAIGDCLLEASEVDRVLCRRLLYGMENGASHGLASLSSRLRHVLRLSPHWSFLRMRTVVPSPRPEKTFTAIEVGELARKAADIRTRAGEHVRPVFVLPARESGEYHNGFLGNAVTLRTT